LQLLCTKYRYELIILNAEHETLSTYYWKEINNEIGPVLHDVKDILLVIHNSIDFDDMVDFLNRLPGADTMIYVSLTKSFPSIQRSAELVRSQMQVIDCVSGELFDQGAPEGCVYDTAPSSLNETITFLNKILQSAQPSYIIVDALSQLVDFSGAAAEGESVMLFSNHVRDLCAKSGTRIIFMYDDYRKHNLKKLPTSYLKPVIRIEVFKDIVSWQG
jgi:hypothetical protein